MERGAATRGKVASAVAGADDIEIKATIPEHQIEQALKRFGLTASNDEERYIYLFDTPLPLPRLRPAIPTPSLPIARACGISPNGGCSGQEPG